jgi:hypothetical protein
MTSKQKIVTILYGLAGWFAAAQFLRLTGPQLFDLGLLHSLVLGFAAALAYPTIWIGSRLAGIAMDRMLGPTVLFTATATLADGLAVTFAPQIYGGPGPDLAYAAGTILFGVGALLVLAAVLQGRPESARTL